ncbi:protein NETWORKED 3C-like [Impatiens glandulifera]|uniref:protein NETWORKED 3C-like n=1 Tax=Impatiens glandulifera TaxID=253017 RepID=UPI001FB1181A|nr:protein NETWORKED 3C-like [Impatiens glandulifera]XP_047336457.1 protein NETWORKED 3C-like [Impatiens glandulifera]
MKMTAAAAAVIEQKSVNRWWFDRNTNDPSPKRSLWLHSTLSELDETTMAMLKIIDEDADSFAKRAEMYYKKRPELIGMVEDMYQSHRSLAVRFDQLKTETGSRLIAPLSSPFRYNRTEKQPSNLSTMTFSEKSYDSYSETYDPEESAESEIDDPEEEVETEEDAIVVAEMKGMKLREEMEEEKKKMKKKMKDEMKQKDEEKREVIRQLSMALNMVKEENLKLKKKLAEIPKDYSTPNKGKVKGISPIVEFKRLKDTFMGKLFFNGSSSSPRTKVKIPL